MEKTMGLTRKDRDMTRNLAIGRVKGTARTSSADSPHEFSGLQCRVKLEVHVEGNRSYSH